MIRSLAPTTALALVLTAQGALADVTPEEVWDSWQAFSTGAGQELTVGSTARNGDTLEVRGLVVTLKDDLGGSFSATIDTLDFTDNGDGTVTVRMADSYPLALAFPAGTDGPSSVKLTVNQPGLTILAGGSATETSYRFTAPTVAVVLDEVLDQSGTVLPTAASVTMTDTTADYLVTRAGETTALQSSFAADSLEFTLSGASPDGNGDGSMSLTMAEVAGATNGTFLGAEVMANMALALNQGFTTDSRMTFGPTRFDATITEGGTTTTVASTATGGNFEVAVDQARISYGSGLTGASFVISGAEIPFPEVRAEFGELGFGFRMPASRSDVPQDFAILTRLVDFTVSEEIWGLIDPTATLSREPASFVADIKGQGRWLVDIMDPEVQASGMEPPGELSALDLTQLLIKGAGAEVGATGALIFDNSTLEPFGGMPEPNGSINVTIKGVNQLIDNLITMGLLPEDQAMGFRMMLGMFTRPGAGGDEVTSLIEFRDGGIFANGQQLQ
jgi:hypothetical protein